jgi:hypothetical protein
VASFWKVDCTVEVPIGICGKYVMWIIHLNLSLATGLVGAPAPKVIPHQKAVMVIVVVVAAFSLKAIH